MKPFNDVTGEKVILAKLLAQENINVEMAATRTASFDLQTRTLTIPELKSGISQDIMTLFIGHEVGHALWTPVDGWSEAIKDVNKGVLNIVEDARIENKIKQKYPGIRYNFIKGYAELLKNNFFEVAMDEIDSLRFLDRLNLHAKLGAHVGIKFSPEEYVFVDKAIKTETFQEVIDLTKEIIKFIKEQRKKEGLETQVFEGGFSNDLQNAQDTFDLDGEDGDSENHNKSVRVEGDKSDLPKDESTEDGVYSNGKGLLPEQNDEFSEDLSSDTDESLSRNLSSIFDDSSYPIVYVDIPKFNGLDYVFDYKRVIEKLNTEQSYYHAKLPLITENDRTRFLKFKKDSLPVVSYLVKEFELKKNADQMKKAQSAKTGDLNPNKLYSYKFNDDIFKKLTVLPEGKSHGLVIFLDWSGSMQRVLKDSIEQCLNLVMFCRKANIPFEVYAFSNHVPNDLMKAASTIPSHETTNVMSITNTDVTLLNLFSSKMTANELSYMAEVLLTPDIATKRYWLHLGGTPLDHTIILASDIVPKFRKSYKLQEVNTVFITDGDSHQVGFFRNYEDYNGKRRIIPSELTPPCYRTYIRDKETKITMKVLQEDCTKVMMNYFKKKTGSKAICFRIVNKFDEAHNLVTKEFHKHKNTFAKEKSISIKTETFDRLNIIKRNALKIEEKEMKFDSSASKAKMLSEFKKFRSNKLNSRTFLREFINEIS